jgi:DNA-binding LacI/PurR family transcriptional regulator
MKGRVRLVDLANELGVSVNTVSLALSGSKRISAQTRQLVEQTARKRGYVPNGFARSLVKQESNYVGVVLRSLRSPVLINIAREIESALKERGYFMVLMSAKGNALSEITALRIQQVSGLLIYPDFSEVNLGQFERLRNSGFPLILMSSDGKVDGLDVVYMDRTVGAYRATKHLLSLGHREIGYLAGDACKTEGYRQALAEHGIDYDERNVKNTDGITYRSGYDAAQSLLEERKEITALFAATDAHAIGAMRYCMDKGVAVPEQIAIVGYDNIDEAEFAQVRLTTIAYDIKREVELAINLMERRMSEKEVGGAEVIRLEPQLIIRDSCGFNALQDSSKKGRNI